MAEFVVEFGKKGTAPPLADGRLDAPAFHRNHEAIWSALETFLTAQSGDVLEIGSGTGQHAVAYAGRTPALTWWPSDIYDGHLASIEAWRRHSGLTNLRAPQRIDLTNANWTWAPGGELAAMLCFNVVHISPWNVAENLLRGAARFLRPGGCLFVYGPFMRDGVHTAPSNAAFDAKLRAENPAWGVRDIRDLQRLAHRVGLAGPQETPMPANNLVLSFEQTASQV